MIEAGRDFAEPLDIDSIIGLGGGSSMDTGKAINFLLTSGGVMQDYWGYGKSRAPMLPMIGIPTTSGTGSEAQSYALISDAETHVKMACGDPGAAFKIAILDPLLTLSQPASVTATAGFDAISHAVETWVTTKRNAASETLSLEAWRLLEPKRLGKFELMQWLGHHSSVEGIAQVAAHNLHGVVERPPGKLRPAPSKELVER